MTPRQYFLSQMRKLRPSEAGQPVVAAGRWPSILPTLQSDAILSHELQDWYQTQALISSFLQPIKKES